MKQKIILPLFIATLGAASVFSQPAPTVVDSVAMARAKIDSLRSALEKTIYSEKQEKAWTDCGDRKMTIFTKNRTSDRPFHKADSLLHISKENKVPPSDPKVQELMRQKFVLQQKWEQKYRLSPEGKRCTTLENHRKHLLDSAMATNPDYPAWKHLTEPVPPK